jgi:hypothetical protein
VEEKRRKLEEHARERARIEAALARQRERERIEKLMQEDLAMQRELTLQHHMKQVCSLTLQHHMKQVCSLTTNHARLLVVGVGTLVARSAQCEVVVVAVEWQFTKIAREGRKRTLKERIKNHQIQISVLRTVWTS